jgi:hypothetical protein
VFPALPEFRFQSACVAPLYDYGQFLPAPKFDVDGFFTARELLSLFSFLISFSGPCDNATYPYLPAMKKMDDWKGKDALSVGPDWHIRQSKPENHSFNDWFV